MDTLPTPANLTQNFLAGNRMVFTIAELRGFEYNITNVNLPSIQLNVAVQNTPFATLKHPGDKITFGNLDVTFLVDENLSNWNAISYWMFANGFPQSYGQYKRNATDGTITVFSNHQNPTSRMQFVNLVPTSLSGLTYSGEDSETDYKKATVSFEIDFYTIEPA